MTTAAKVNSLASTDVGQLPRWDLSNVYLGLETDSLRKTISDLGRQVDSLDEYLDRHKISRTANPVPAQVGSQAKPLIDGYLERTNRALRLYSTINAYVSSYVTTDSYNTTAKRLESELEIVGVRLEKQEVRFRGWIGTIKEALPSILEAGGVAKDHAFYLRETAEQSRYLMSEPEEALASELELSGSNAWSKLQGTICSQLTVNFELDGKQQTIQ